MGWPVVIAANGRGIPVTESPNGTPYEIATNGYGTPVVFVDKGGLPVTLAGVSVPAWFDWKPTFQVRRSSGVYSASITAAALRPAAGTTLYVSPSGNNANDGSTPALAKRSIASAYNAGATTIIAAPGDYTRQNGFEGLTLAARDLIIINSDPDSGSVIIARFESPTSLTWVADGTYANVWHCTRSTAVAVRDRSVVDANGNIQRLTPRADLAALDAASEGQFITGSTVNVKLSDGRQPDSDVLVFMSAANGVVTAAMAGKTLWVGDGIEFWGGDTALATSGLSTSDNTRIVCEGVKFKYATSASFGNGLSASNLAECYLFGCGAEANNLDGFNYHYAGGGVGRVLEVDCIGRANGFTGGSNNGSSIHEAGQIIRLNGLYISNEGPQVADTNTSQSWNLGCRASGGETNWAALLTAEMTLDNCSSDDGVTDLSVAVGAVAYTRSFTSGGVFVGVPTPY